MTPRRAKIIKADENQIFFPSRNEMYDLGQNVQNCMHARVDLVLSTTYTR